MLDDDLKYTLGSIDDNVTNIVACVELLSVLTANPDAETVINGIRLIVLQIGDNANAIQDFAASIQRQLSPARRQSCES